MLWRACYNDASFSWRTSSLKGKLQSLCRQQGSASVPPSSPVSSRGHGCRRTLWEALISAGLRGGGGAGRGRGRGRGRAGPRGPRDRPSPTAQATWQTWGSVPVSLGHAPPQGIPDFQGKATHALQKQPSGAGEEQNVSARRASNGEMESRAQRRGPSTAVCRSPAQPRARLSKGTFQLTGPGVCDLHARKSYRNGGGGIDHSPTPRHISRP